MSLRRTLEGLDASRRLDLVRTFDDRISIGTRGPLEVVPSEPGHDVTVLTRSR